MLSIDLHQQLLTDSDGAGTPTGRFGGRVWALLGRQGLQQVVNHGSMGYSNAFPSGVRIVEESGSLLPTNLVRAIGDL